MKPRHLVAVLAAALAAAAGAQTMKPGLWEVTQSTHSTDARTQQSLSQMQQQMANMSPEQRKMVEEMMARQGVKMDPAGGVTAKVCMTREMVENNDLPSQQGDCKTTRQSRSGNTMKFFLMCVNPPSAGEGQVTLTSPEAYTMKVVVTSQSQAKPQKMTMEGSGKWLAPDCGNVKPIVPPAKK